jgi:hypothetical protein
MEAAPAMSEPKSGKAAVIADWAATEVTSGSASTTATVEAAHRPERAEVKGRMAPALAPWLAYLPY